MSTILYNEKNKNGEVQFYSLRERKGNTSDKSHCTENNSIFIKDKIQKCPDDKYQELYDMHLKKYNIQKLHSEPPLSNKLSSHLEKLSNNSSPIASHITSTHRRSFDNSGPRIMSYAAAAYLVKRPPAYY